MEISLQMGMQGQAYMHSDLGGFAGAVLDDELYVRWLQYGVFQPVFRPHAQEEVAAEPVFREPRTRALAREAVRLRYAMLPYNYTIAFENSRTGMPMMRPMLFEEADDDAAPAISSTYLWGPSFLVAPVTEQGAARKEVHFPKPGKEQGSVWFDFYNDAPHRGGITEVVATVPDHIPVYVRAGAFVPLAKVVQSTRDYSSRSLELHYWHDASVKASSGQLYDDDGKTRGAFEAGKYELVRFSSRADGGKLEIGLHPEAGARYSPPSHSFALNVHNVARKPRSVQAGGKPLKFRWNAQRRLLEVALPLLRQAPMVVTITL
jgi:alpha-glucosidase (family GH31 glycosyl hydrolase)